MIDFLLDFTREDRSTRLEEVVNYFNDAEQFEWYRIETIRRLISNNQELQLSETELDHIRNWCEKMIQEVDFSNALQTLEDGSHCYSPVAKAIWFFAHKFDFSFGREVTLDLLFMLRLPEKGFDDPQSQSKISYFTNRLSIEEIKERMVGNMEGKISDSRVILQHLSFLISFHFNHVGELIRQELLNGHRDIYHKCEILDFFDSKELDVKLLLDVLQKAEFSLRWEVVKKLNRMEQLHLIEEYLLKRLQYPDNNEDQINAAEYLVRLNNVNGIAFFFQWLKNDGIPRDTYSNRYECIGQISTEKALPFLFDLLEFSYQTNKVSNVFDRLDRIVLESIENVAQSSEEAFQLAVRGLNNFMETTSYKNVNFLYFNIERIKKKYYGKVITSYTFGEAVRKLEQLQNT